ncbi:hypothetical protein FGIG_11818 [Fasciola gigantica]|uniref:Uncharacterized protein n=1 Tax=Fasciola gigantica TaxID=46835 RepID=A0A504YX81_FASGI|nr:hypothetical protein FGIG_11818 [Fasciola gigantica]
MCTVIFDSARQGFEYSRSRMGGNQKSFKRKLNFTQKSNTIDVTHSGANTSAITTMISCGTIRRRTFGTIVILASFISFNRVFFL